MVFNRHCLWRLNPWGAIAMLWRTKRSCRTVRQLASPFRECGKPPNIKKPAHGGLVAYGSI